MEEEDKPKKKKKEEKEEEEKDTSMEIIDVDQDEDKESSDHTDKAKASEEKKVQAEEEDEEEEVQVVKVVPNPDTKPTQQQQQQQEQQAHQQEEEASRQKRRQEAGVSSTAVEITLPPGYPSIHRWTVKDGSMVRKGETIALISKKDSTHHHHAQAAQTAQALHPQAAGKIRAPVKKGSGALSSLIRSSSTSLSDTKATSAKPPAPLTSAKVTTLLPVGGKRASMRERMRRRAAAAKNNATTVNPATTTTITANTNSSHKSANTAPASNPKEEHEHLDKLHAPADGTLRILSTLLSIHNKHNTGTNGTTTTPPSIVLLVVGYMEPCTHSTVVDGMCAVCGKTQLDLLEEREQADAVKKKKRKEEEQKKSMGLSLHPQEGGLSLSLSPASSLFDPSSSSSNSNNNNNTTTDATETEPSSPLQPQQQQVTLPGGITMQVSTAEAQSLSQQSQQTLRRHKKLSLVLDLDHTLVHATADPRAGQVALKREDVRIAFLRPSLPPGVVLSPVVGGAGGAGAGGGAQEENQNQPGGGKDQISKDGRLGTNQSTPSKTNPPTTPQLPPAMPHFIKMRPHLQTFLQQVQQRYELSIYTAGTRAYALQVANVMSRFMVGVKEDEDECRHVRQCLKEEERRLRVMMARRVWEEERKKEKQQLEEKENKENKEKGKEGGGEKQDTRNANNNNNNNNNEKNKDSEKQDQNKMDIDTPPQQQPHHEATNQTDKNDHEDTKNNEKTSQTDENNNKDNNNKDNEKKDTSHEKIKSNSQTETSPGRKRVSFGALPPDPPTKKKKSTTNPILHNNKTQAPPFCEEAFKQLQTNVQALRNKVREVDRLEKKAAELAKSLFGNRIVSRTDVGDLGRDVKSLRRVFPCGGMMTAIVDDREDVWANAMDNEKTSNRRPGEPPVNMLFIKPYHWKKFVGYADVNNASGQDLTAEEKKGEKSDSASSSSSSSLENTKNEASQKDDGAKVDGGGGGDRAEDDWDDHGEQQLLATGRVLKRLHERFYAMDEQNSSLRNANTNDTEHQKNQDITVPRVLAAMRKEVLHGCKIVLSGLVPLHRQDRAFSDLSRPRPSVVRYAEDLGAIVVPDVTRGVTHVVAARLGTDKVKRGGLTVGCAVVKISWLMNCYWKIEQEDVTSHLWMPVRTQPEKVDTGRPGKRKLAVASGAPGNDAAGGILLSDGSDDDDEDDTDDDGGLTAEFERDLLGDEDGKEDNKEDYEEGLDDMEEDILKGNS